MDTPSLQAHIEQLSQRMTWRLVEQLFHSQRYKEKATLRKAGGAVTQSGWKPNLGVVTHKEEGYHRHQGPP